MPALQARGADPSLARGVSHGVENQTAAQKPGGLTHWDFAVLGFTSRNRGVLASNRRQGRCFNHEILERVAGERHLMSLWNQFSRIPTVFPSLTCSYMIDAYRFLRHSVSVPYIARCSFINVYHAFSPRIAT
jgi:hypothetical protein